MRNPILLAFFFLSGTSGLVFEVIWSRMLTLIFGSSTFALSALLTAFMTGLAVGSEVMGRRSRRVGRPLRLYGVFEASIGLYALIVPILLAFLPGLYAPVVQSLFENFWLFSFLRFLLVFVVLVVPTFLMGATLPLLTEEVARAGGGWEGGAGLLYGVNTLGACAGTMISGFYALPTFGLTHTNMAFAGLSLTLGSVVVLYDFVKGREEGARAPSSADGPAREFNLFADEPEHRVGRQAILIVLGAFCLASGVSMAYQVYWTRAYLMILGSSTYSFTLILSTFLIGLGGGSALMSASLRFVRRPLMILALVQVGVAAAATLCLFTLNKAPELLFFHLRAEGGSAANIYIYSFFLIALVVFIPTFLQGMTYPLVIRIVGSHARHRRGSTEQVEAEAGRLAGRAYAIGTAGAIVGSFSSGFVLLPLVGLRASILIAVVANLGVGVAVAVLSLRARATLFKAAVLGAPLLAGAVLVFAAPDLELTKLSSGAFRVYWSRELFTPKTFFADHPKILFYEDGVAATISVERRGKLVTLKANGKPEASSGADMATQILVGLLPLVMHEATPTAKAAIERGDYGGPTDVAMVGFGSGVSAGGTLAYPLKNFDVVEIESAMIGASHYFDEVNNRPLEDHRLRVIESDGRNFLEYVDKKYDVIISEPSNPWIAGVATLFSLEHFERARRKLKPGGIYSQWVQLYELRAENVARILKTFKQVFPHVMIFSSMEKGTDLIMIGSEDPITIPAEGYPLAWSNNSVVNELRRAGVGAVGDIPGLLFLGDDEIDPFVAAQEARLGHEIDVNTDDNGILEYEAPKDLIHYGDADRFFAKIYYGDAIYGDPRPYLEGYSDPSRWGPDATAELAYSAFIKGKQRLAGELATESLRRGRTELATKTLAAWQLYDAGPESGLIAHWPFRNSEIHAVVVAAINQKAPMAALEYLYATQSEHGDVFEDPEVTLAASYLFYETQYYKRSHGQLLILEHHSDFLWRSPIVHLLLGFTWTRRRHYDEAFAHLMRFYEIEYQGKEERAPLR